MTTNFRVSLGNFRVAMDYNGIENVDFDTEIGTKTGINKVWKESHSSQRCMLLVEIVVLSNIFKGS